MINFSLKCKTLEFISQSHLMNPPLDRKEIHYHNYP